MTVAAPAKPRTRTGRVPRPAEERFLSKVDRTGGPGACHPWTAGTSNGYGSFRIRAGQVVPAHSYAKFLATGIVCPPGREAQHVTCPPGSKLCCNPEHIIYGKPGTNGRRVRGAAHPRAKLTDAQVRDIRTRRAAGERRADLAAEYGVSRGHISHLTAGIRRRHVL